MKIVKKIIRGFFEFALAGVAFGLLFNLAWLFGHQIVEGPGLVGNDSDFALSLVSWFGRWWPRIPLWYPLQGAGVSLFHSYPMFSTFLIIWIKDITHLSAPEVFRILSFVVFPLTAFGIYVLARRKIGNCVAAFFAGVFFLLSQASWVFQRLHGIFAQSFSMIFVPWSFLFFDVFLTRRINQPKNDFITRAAAVLTVLFTALTFLSHVVTGTVVVLSFLAYAVFYSQLSLPLKAKIKKRLGNLFKNLGPAVFCVMLTIFLIAFWLIPFYAYNHLANREGLLNMGLGQLKEVSLLPRTLVGFGDFATGDLRYDYFFFALPVMLLALIGLFGSGLRKKSVFSWGLVAFGAALFTSLPLYLPALVNLFRYIFTAVYFRALIATIILLPVLAGFGAFFVVDWPFWLAASLTREKSAKLRGVSWQTVRLGFSAVKWIVVSLGVLLVSLFFINRFEHQPPSEATQAHPAYGISAFKAYGPTLGEDMEILKNDWSILFKKPEIKISQEGAKPTLSLLGFIKDFDLDKTSRVDVSAYSGESFLQRAPLVTEATFVNLYHYFASLIHRMWGYQQGVFYGHEPLYDNPQLLKELSYWFGIEYTVLVSGFDREENYQKVGWELVKPGGTQDNPLPIYHFPETEGLLTVSDRPVALVIGSFENEVYDQVFRSSNAGAFSYHDLWLVEGNKQIDDYSLEDLADFDLLILHGYGYKSKGKAWSLIEKFVEKGGRVFIDTGWQYVCRDWSTKNGETILPPPSPVTRTTWGEVSKEWESLEIDSSLGKFKTASFKPFLWGGNPWGAALSKESWLSEGARVLIKDKDQVVVAISDFGQGKIVWSGLNLFSHAQGAEGEKEIGVLKAIFDLLIKKEGSNYQSVVWQRDFPDVLEIKFEKEAPEQWLLWREAFTPNWRATLVGRKQELKIYRGGPGFVLIRLPAVSLGETLRLEYRLGWFEGGLAKLISGLTLLVLTGYLLIGERAEKVIRGKFGKSLGGHWKRISRTISVSEDEDY